VQLDLLVDRRLFAHIGDAALEHIVALGDAGGLITPGV